MRSNQPSNAVKLWNDQSSWFWLVVDPNRGGATGVAASETEAIDEACASFESDSIAPALTGWTASLANLDNTYRHASDLPSLPPAYPLSVIPSPRAA